MVVLAREDAEQLIDEAQAREIYVLGVDAFHLRDVGIEPDMAMDSAPFPKQDGWDLARDFLKERDGLGLHFEFVLAGDPPGPTAFLDPTLDSTSNRLRATWRNRGDAAARAVTLSLIAPHGSDLADREGERIQSEVHDRWGRYFYLGQEAVVPGEIAFRHVDIVIPVDQPQEVALWSSAGERRRFRLDATHA